MVGEKQNTHRCVENAGQQKAVILLIHFDQVGFVKIFDRTEFFRKFRLVRSLLDECNQTNIHKFDIMSVCISDATCCFDEAEVFVGAPRSVEQLQNRRFAIYR